MKNIIIDTNVFLRYLLNDVPSQVNKIEAIFKQAKKGRLRLFVPQIIIFEIAYALDKFYKFPKSISVEKLKSVLSADFLEIQDVDSLKNSLETYSKEPISFVDCFLIARARLEEAEIFTFDQKLRKLTMKV